jgi:pyruvate dehydrogenase E2 component (dihydrolipoamide acetyltransferase)
MPTIVTMPALSPTMEEGTITSWFKKEGDKVADGEAICAIATDKSTVEFQAIDGGYLRKIVAAVGSNVKVNEPIAVICLTLEENISNLTFTKEKEEFINLSPEEKKKEVPSLGLNVMTFSPFAPKGRLPVQKKTSEKASPYAKKLALDLGINISSIKGSGPSGRIVAKDLSNGVKSNFPLAKKEYKYPDGTFEEIPLTPVRKIIGDRLQASKMTIPHYVISLSVVMDKVMGLREELKELGIKVTFNDFVIKAVALALSEHPEINTGYDSKKNVIIQFKTVDISIAVSIADGLITPILWQADYLSLADISIETKKLAAKAKDGTLEPSEYQGGSFTISNLGMFGVTSFSAVINPPQAAILAVGGILETAISKGGVITSGNLMNLSISLDHRVIDGAAGARFLNTVKKYLEHPVCLIL